MAKLSRADAQFLATVHGIDASETFDGSEMTVREIRARMSSDRLLIAYGKPCIRGHYIRAAGGCVRCNPEAIGHARTARKSGFVYIAKSAQARLLKIGFSEEDPHNRIYIARCVGYGGFYDWKIRCLAFSDRAGRIEIDMKDVLKPYHHPMPWIDKGKQKMANEIYKCTLTRAYDTVAGNPAVEQIQWIRA